MSDIDANTVTVWMRLPRQDGQPIARSVMAVRRSAARSFFQTAFVLGLTDANPAKAVELPDRTERYVHALTDDQVRQAQRVARTQIDDTRTPAVLALIMSGAATIEIGSVTVADVDLPYRRVWVHDGGYRYRPRWITLDDDWCLDAVTRRVAAVPHDRLYVGTETDRALVARRSGVATTRGKQQSVMAHIVTGVLNDSGVYQPGVTRAESIREWLAARVYNDTGSLEQAALRLGMSSLDSIAHIVGSDWVTDLTTDGPRAHRQPALDAP